MISFPGASFVYTLLKDGLSWFRGRRFQLWAKGWTVDRWYDQSQAYEKFGDQDWLRYYKQEQEKASVEWGKAPRRAEDYYSPHPTISTIYRQCEDKMAQYDFLIREDLHERLARGELIARGFREPFSHGAPYLTISRHEWLIIKLVYPDRAEGGGVSYIGVTIGKAGTRSIFRPLKQ
jgi:hypothetical protein